MSENVHHGPSLRIFFVIWIGLLILTAVTVGVSYLELGPFNPIVALVIATCKAMMVILFFMELRHSSKITMVVVIAGLFWLGILLTLSLSDYLTRSWNQIVR
jgi:cytochrome c oxidase subunit IV